MRSRHAPLQCIAATSGLLSITPICWTAFTPAAPQAVHYAAAHSHCLHPRRPLQVLQDCHAALGPYQGELLQEVAYILRTARSSSPAAARTRQVAMDVLRHFGSAGGDAYRVARQQGGAPAGARPESVVNRDPGAAAAAVVAVMRSEQVQQHVGCSRMALLFCHKLCVSVVSCSGHANQLHRNLVSNPTVARL